MEKRFNLLVFLHLIAILGIIVMNNMRNIKEKNTIIIRDYSNDSISSPDEKFTEFYLDSNSFENNDSLKIKK